MAEDTFRLGVFYKNLLKIESHNKAGHSWTMALNQFADLTHEEYVGLFVQDQTKLGEPVPMPEAVAETLSLGQQVACDKRNILFRQFMQQDYNCNNAYTIVAATTMNTNYYASKS